MSGTVPSEPLTDAAPASRRSGLSPIDIMAMSVGVGLAAFVSALGERPLAGVFAAIWWISVVVIVRSDLADMVIPDGASLAVAGLGLAYNTAIALAAGEPWWNGLGSVVGSALNGLASFALFWLVALTYRGLARREGLGFGDVKLAGASAIWLEPGDAALALEIAAVATLALLLLRRQGGSVRDIPMPFGAFLAPSAWIVFVSGPTLHSALDRLG